MRKKHGNIFKICVLGDEGIGKEQFIALFAKKFYVKNIYTDTALSFGVNFYWESILVKTEKGVQENRIHIWNFIGHERFKFLRKSFMTGTRAFMLFFDLGNRNTFQHLNNWMCEVRDYTKKDPKKKVPILIIGNKSDDKNFAVSPKEIDNFITQNEVNYIETSTATKEGIFDSFYCITSLILDVEINNKYFMSKENIYRPTSKPNEKVSEGLKLSPKDLSSLSQEIVFKVKESEDEVTISKQKNICLVCKGEVSRNNYICPECKTFYCLKCVKSLIKLENACWVCTTPFDESKPSKPYNKYPIDTDVPKTDKDTNY